MRYAVVAILLAIIVGVMSAGGAHTGLLIVAMFLAAICTLAFLRVPEIIVPLLFATFPLEISKKYFPWLRIEKGLDGQDLSMLELSRIVLILGILVFVLTGSVSKLLKFAKYGMGKWSLVLLSFCCLQVGFADTDPHRASIEIVRLAALILSMFVTAAFLTSIERVEAALKAFVLSATVIAIVGVWQHYTGHFFWNLDLARLTTPRINVTFGDPNILARYLVVLILVVLATIERGLIKNWQIWLAVSAGAASLLFTYSRSNWFFLPMGMLILWWYARGQAKRRMTKLAVIVIAGVSIMFGAIPSLRSRVELLSNDPNRRLEGRSQLARTAIEMYKDHLPFGTGLGSFAFAAERNYSEYLPYAGSYVKESHTAILTVMAELGTVGLILTILLLKSCWDSLRRILRNAGEPSRSYAVSCVLALLAIVVSAQSEGRMLDEPLLWLFMGMLLAIENLIEQETQGIVDENTADFFDENTPAYSSVSS